MEFIRTEIPEVILVKPTLFEDSRGYFMESYHIDEFKAEGIHSTFVQDNQAKSVKNTLRGLHFQIKYPQAKLLRCLSGEILDVAVDIRIGSPTFKQWVSIKLSSENKHQLFIPEGFAHGYFVLSETAEIAYKCSEVYHPEDETGIMWNDNDLEVNWGCEYPLLSKKDHQWPFLKDQMRLLGA